MRPDKFSMAKSWINDERSTPEEAKATWESMSKEFDENRKAMLMASAESDRIKAMMNEKFGPGTMKYGSEIPQPEIKTPQAIFEFGQRNPAAEGGRMEFDKGGDVTYKGKYEADRYNTVKDIDSLKLKKEKINLKASDFRTGEMRYPDDKGQKYVQEYLDNVEKGYLNNDMSKVERFKTFLKNKYPKTFAKVIADVNHSGYRGMMDIGVDYKRKLANEIITAANNQLKYINQFDIIKKLIPQKRAVTVKNQGINTIGNLLDKDTLNAFRKLDTMEDKLSKSLTYIVDNNVEILDPNKIKIKGSAAAGYQTQSPIKKMMNYLAGGGSRKQLNKALEQNKWYQSQNYKVGKTIRNTFDDLSQAYSTDFIGQNFNDAYDYALNRRGSVSVKGMSKKITPERLIWNFAARSADRHFKDLDNPKDWLVKIVDKNGDVIDYSSLPVDDKGRRIIDTNKYQFLYNGQTFNKNNLSTKGYQSGLFNDVYKATNTITNYLNTDVPDPDNPKKTISLGELFEKTDGRIFASIGHDDAKGGVKKKPFNTFKILTNVENQSLFNAYDKIKSPAVRKQVVDFIYGDTKGLRGERYKEAWVKKNVPFVTEYIKTGKGLEETPYKQKLNEMIKAVGCPVKGKAEGGRIGFAEGADCFDKGQKIINSGFKGASSASMRNGAKLLNSLYRGGRNVMKFGIIPEAIFVGGETLLRSLGDQSLDEGFKSSLGFYTDWTGLTDFKADARISQNMRNMGVDAAMNLERLAKFNDATDKVNKLKQMKESNLAINDELLTGLTDQEFAALADKNIAKAQEYLDKNFLKESEKLYFSQQQDEATDIAGTKSPFKKFLGYARDKTENMGYEEDFSGMQSDMFNIDPMSAKAKKDRVKNLPPQSPLTGSKGEQDFLNLSQLPMGPRMGSEIDVLAKAMNENFKAQGLDQRVDSQYLKAMQDYKQNYKDMTMEEMLAIGIPAEAIYGFNIAEPIKQKPVYDFSEGGITGLRSKYEYKK